MLPTVFKTCVPRGEILAGELSLDLFAAKLRLVVEGKALAYIKTQQRFLLQRLRPMG